MLHQHLDHGCLTATVITGEANALLFALNRPFVPASQTPATGQWNWVGLPQAILINGKGFYGDCDLIGGLIVGAGVAETNPPCDVTTAVVSPGRSPKGSMAAQFSSCDSGFGLDCLGPL